MNGKSTKERKMRTTLEYHEGRHIVYLVPRRPSLVGVLDVIKSGRFLFTSLGKIFRAGALTERK